MFEIKIFRSGKLESMIQSKTFTAMPDNPQLYKFITTEDKTIYHFFSQDMSFVAELVDEE